MTRQMRIVTLRVHPLMKAMIEDAAAHEGVSLAAFMRDSAWAGALRPANPAVQDWVLLTQVVRVLGWEAVHAAYFDALDAEEPKR
jgi:uncharacterized protein (DUF1778 family)